MFRGFLSVVLGLSLVTLAMCSQDVPIKAESYGFSIGAPSGSLHIEFFLDFACSDSKYSFNTWKNVRKLISLQQNNVKLTYQFIPLPYHWFATTIHQAFFFVLKNAGAVAAENFITYVFDNQDSMSEEVYIDKTLNQFVAEFSQKIATLFDVDASALAKDLVIGSESFKQLKDSFRYATIVHGIAGAPLFYANGVLVDGAQDFTYLDWINFIRQYQTVGHKKQEKISYK